MTDRQIWQCSMDHRPESYSKNIIPPKIAEQNVYYIKHKSIKVKGTWMPNRTIGTQVTTKYSVIDNKEMMAPKAHHNHSRLASPSTRLPRGQGEPEDPGPLTCLDQPATERGPTAHQGQGLIMAHQDNPGPT